MENRKTLNSEIYFGYSFNKKMQKKKKKKKKKKNVFLIFWGVKCISWTDKQNVISIISVTFMESEFLSSKERGVDCLI